MTHNPTLSRSTESSAVFLQAPVRRVQLAER
jgi:hypothetical protein